MLLRPEADFELAVRLKHGSATIGEVYSFISGLYFRGKVAYASAFKAAPEKIPHSVIIVPGLGLVPLEARLNAEQLQRIGGISIERDHHAFRAALLRDARLLDEAAGPECHFVLLGSIATDKYVQPLLDVFGERLMFPADFVGRGDMSRGGLMLRSARASTELAYVPVAGATRHGARPPKLAPLPRKRPTPPEAVIFIGLQGSGKTTYYREHLARTHAHVSLDLQKTAKRQDAALREAIAARKPVAIDNTNPTIASRAAFIAQAKAAGYRVIGCFFDVPVRTAIGRNKHREDKKPIPVPAILRAAKLLQTPSREEGFDEIRVVHAAEVPK